MLVLICSMIVSSVIVRVDLVAAVMVTAGAGAGAILPDVQMKRPKNSPLRKIAWGIVQAGRYICMPIISTVFQRFFNTPAESNDKRLTHSVIGAFLYFSILAAIALCPIILFPAKVPVLPIMALIAGLLVGIGLHLTEDMCCRRGILPFYPFSSVMIYGSIRPCDILDPRILGFHIYHGIILFFFMILIDAINLPVTVMLSCSLAAVGICVTSMCWQAEVRTGYQEKRLTDGREVSAT
jgi:hypothetical protein